MHGHFHNIDCIWFSIFSILIKHSLYLYSLYSLSHCIRSFRSQIIPSICVLGPCLRNAWVEKKSVYIKEYGRALASPCDLSTFANEEEEEEKAETAWKRQMYRTEEAEVVLSHRLINILCESKRLRTLN